MDISIKDRFKSLSDESHGSNIRPDFKAFLQRIGREDLDGIITHKTPWAYFSQEVYREKELGVKGDGGLGILAGDITKIAEELSMPLVVVTPYYSGKSRQALFNFWESDGYETLVPGEHGFEKLGTVDVSSLSYAEIPIDVYARRRGSVSVITLYEPNIGLLYYSESNSNHRLYQEAVTGFAGYRAMQSIGVNPVVIHMNEAATVFAAIACLDDSCSRLGNFDEALESTRGETIYTNHTLLQAAEGVFNIGQFEDLIFPNIKNESVINWVRGKFNDDGTIRLSTLAIEIAAKKNGVSKLHSMLSSQNYKDHAGHSVEFTDVTNGISDRWVHQGFMDLCRYAVALDEFGLPTDDYKEMLDKICVEDIRRAKQVGRTHMNHILKFRQDQRGNPIYIPKDAIVFDYKRRLVSYKRFDMIFQDMGRLAYILQTYNAHIIFTGRPHFGDDGMIKELNKILWDIENNPVLKERVHYIQNYDEEVATALVFGGNCAINVPVVGQEACGTSWMKDIANCKLLISTTDGGVADVSPSVYLEVTGSSYVDETNSLYKRMQEACEIIKDEVALRQHIIGQLQAYLPTISGPRMIQDYLNLRFS
jgi:starch phosphorylase